MKYISSHVLASILLIGTFSFNYNLGFNKNLIQKLNPDAKKLETIVIELPFMKNGEVYLEIAKIYCADEVYVEEIKRQERFNYICTLNGKKELLQLSNGNHKNGIGITFRF